MNIVLLIDLSSIQTWLAGKSTRPFMDDKNPIRNLHDIYPLVNVTKNDGKLPSFMGKSTISTGPFSIANCNKLPEGTLISSGLSAIFALYIH
jgi:hypothetical protein